MASAGDVERLFLQAIFSRGILSEKLARLLREKCVEAVQAANDNLDIPYSDDTASWHSFVNRLNNSLDSLHLEFHASVDELTGGKVYTLVNRKDDAIAQLASAYSAVEIAYFKAIVEQIMLAPNEAFSVSSLAALREVNTLKTNMTKTQAEVVLGSFVAKGWLCKSKRGRYSLSTRTLVELSVYLRDTYPDETIECTICMELLTRGIACLTPNCKTRLHYHCFKTNRLARPKCPACSESWPQDADALVPVGEKAVKPGQDDIRRQVRRRSVEEDEDEDEDEEEPSQPSQPSQQPKSQAPPRTQRNRKGKGKQDKMDVDDDEELEEDSPPKRSQPTRRSRRK